MHPVLSPRLDAVHRHRDTLGLDTESLRVLERYHLDFVRSGAQLKGGDATGWPPSRSGWRCWAPSSARMCWAMRRLDLSLNESQMAGIPPAIRDAAGAKAAALNLDAPFAVTLSRSSVEPFLPICRRPHPARTALPRPGVRAATMTMARNTQPPISEMLSLRAERAHAAGL